MLELGIAVVVIEVLREPVLGQLVYSIAKVDLYTREICRVGMFLPTSAIVCFASGCWGGTSFGEDLGDREMKGTKYTSYSRALAIYRFPIGAVNV